jgi:hypothetical protein
MRWTSDHRRSWLVGLVVLVSMLGLGACAPPTLPMQQPVVVDPSGRILRDDVIDLRRAFGVYPNEWSRWIAQGWAESRLFSGPPCPLTDADRHRRKPPPPISGSWMQQRTHLDVSRWGS